MSLRVVHTSQHQPTSATGATSAVGLESPAFPLTSATGGEPEVVIAVFFALLVATALSVYLAYRLYRGYREGGGTGMLILGIGLVLLTTAPMLLRLLLSNVSPIDPVWQEVVATASQLVGLVCILGVIYGRR